MPLLRAFEGILRRSRRLPAPIRITSTIGVVAAFFLIRRGFDHAWPDTYPFLIFYLSIIICSTFFSGWMGVLATLLSAAASVTIYAPKTLATISYLIMGLLSAAIIQTLNHALSDLEETLKQLQHSENHRLLQLREFRHRTRNDLQNLVGLLLLRARSIQDVQCKDSLKDAAAHAMALARVHTRLAGQGDREYTALVDTHEFITGLCHDMEKTLSVDGIRPIAISVSAESHAIDAERAVHLGMALNELLAKSLKHAFPGELGGTIQVVFCRKDYYYILTVRDDGIGIVESMKRKPGTGFSTRLLNALAAQLRGKFDRGEGEDGIGTCSEMRFPVASPNGKYLK